MGERLLSKESRHGERNTPLGEPSAEKSTASRVVAGLAFGGKGWR